MKVIWGVLIASICAGAVTGLLGAGGGMILVPLLTALTSIPEDKIFSSSICIILPVCLASLAAAALWSTLDWKAALPYLLGSALGGFVAGYWGKKIPTLWLHRGLGVLILWGGLRYLC